MFVFFNFYFFFFLELVREKNVRGFRAVNSSGQHKNDRRKRIWMRVAVPRDQICTQPPRAFMGVRAHVGASVVLPVMRFARDRRVPRRR